VILVKLLEFRDSDLKILIETLASKQDQIVLVKWAADCAERVLCYFEEYFTEDNNPKNAIKTCRTWIDQDVSVTEARKRAFESHETARNIEMINISACYAARSAAQAVSTIHVSGHAVHAATYAVKAKFYKENTNRDEEVEIERTWQYKRLKELTEQNLIL